jgi:predicted DNA-binding transcriptional regulator AlpA
MVMRNGPQASGQAHPTPTTKAGNSSGEVPAPLADVALIDARQSASAACVSLSTFYEMVKDGRAPQPAFRGVRCTRWRLTDIRAWLVEFARTGIAGGEQ